MIKALQLCKSYGKIKAIDDISFELPAGEILGLLGTNGAGKTTTLRILSGFMPPTSGSVEIYGEDLRRHPQKIRAHIGYLPEQTPLYLDMTVTRYLNFVAAIKGMPRAEIPAQTNTVMQRLNILDVQKRLIGHLSRGYRQRVALAQALVHRPKLVILDEPTLGLDPMEVTALRQIIRDLRSECTVILSSHILSEIQSLCTYVGMMKLGKLVAFDSLGNLTQDQKLLFSLKINGLSHEYLREQLAKIEWITSVQSNESTPGKLTVELGFRGDIENLSAQIYHVSAKNHWTLLEMAPVRNNLEDVFLRAMQ